MCLVALESEYLKVGSNNSGCLVRVLQYPIVHYMDHCASCIEPWTNLKQ